MYNCYVARRKRKILLTANEAKAESNKVPECAFHAMCRSYLFSVFMRKIEANDPLCVCATGHNIII